MSTDVDGSRVTRFPTVQTLGVRTPIGLSGYFHHLEKNTGINECGVVPNKINVVLIELIKFRNKMFLVVVFCSALHNLSGLWQLYIFYCLQHGGVFFIHIKNTFLYCTK